GALVVPEREELAARIYYPSADFQKSTQDGTSATGLFVYVHRGTAPESFLLTVKGPGDYPPRNVAATPGSALVLTLSPGDATR
ncbi:MAG: carboxypeptidase regulatory-like domain-containing protein, partial [Cystobacter sp.]